MASLNNYRLYPPDIVINDDKRDPYVSWQHHLDRTNRQRGGIDLVAKVGTPVYAPTPGRMFHVPNDGGAGNSCRFNHDLNAGYADVFSHLSEYVGESGKHFKQGEVIAFTGNTGGVTQHLHRHLLNPQGIRVNPYAYFSRPDMVPGDFDNVVRDIIVASGMQIQGIEQNQSPDQKETYLRIKLYGPGFSKEFAPDQRDLFNAVRAIVNGYAKKMGQDPILPSGDMFSVDKWGYNAITQTFG